MKKATIYEILNADVLKRYDGITYLESKESGVPVQLVDYLFDGVGRESLQSIKITGGILKYLYKPKINQLWILIEFQVESKLNEAQLNQLEKFCVGQWYDGAGPGLALDVAEKFDAIGPLGYPYKVYCSYES